jgi:prepilin-type N-terminal cleavage/methylation domain-containing protein/prepilin-type processing-associated H-X9-DG protein
MHQAMGRHGRVSAEGRTRSESVWPSAKAGFTVTELLVAIAVFSLLAALLFPAVQQAREASRRTQCVSNLRQIGIAIGAYESAYSVLPSGASPQSLHVSLLPYTEQRALYEEYESLAARHDCCGGLVTPPLLKCPSDPASELPGRGNYAGNIGTGVQRHGFNGIFQFLDGWSGYWPSGVLRYRDVTDGTSQTVAVSELLPGRSQERDRRRMLWHIAESLGDAGQPEALAARCAAASTPPDDGDPVAAIWWSGNPGHALYNHVLTPNQTSCVSQSLWIAGVFNSASEHPSGVNALFADGHVRLIGSHIAADVWHGVGSRNGREVLPQF